MGGRRASSSCPRLLRKLRQLELLAPDDLLGLELILDDALRHRLKHIETTPLWRRAVAPENPQQTTKVS